MEAQEEFAYFLYDKDNRRLDRKTRISLSISAAEDPQNRDLLNIIYAWQVLLDGKTISQDRLLISNQRSNPEAQSKMKVI